MHAVSSSDRLLQVHILNDIYLNCFTVRERKIEGESNVDKMEK
jgi:hypothetical protein